MPCWVRRPRRLCERRLGPPVSCSPFADVSCAARACSRSPTWKNPPTRPEGSGRVWNTVRRCLSRTDRTTSQLVVLTRARSRRPGDPEKTGSCRPGGPACWVLLLPPRLSPRHVGVLVDVERTPRRRGLPAALGRPNAFALRAGAVRVPMLVACLRGLTRRARPGRHCARTGGTGVASAGSSPATPSPPAVAPLFLAHPSFPYSPLSAALRRNSPAGFRRVGESWRVDVADRARWPASSSSPASHPLTLLLCTPRHSFSLRPPRSLSAPSSIFSLFCPEVWGVCLGGVGGLW